VVAALALLTALAAPPPLGEGPAVRPSVLRGVPADQTAWVWTPADIAAWSGSGLRDAHVRAMAPSPRGLWVLGPSGVALWNGRAWAHIDRRDGVGTAPWYDLALDGSTRWLAHSGGVTRILGDGTVRRWEFGDGLPEGPVHAVHPIDGGAWVATEDGIFEVTDVVMPLRQGLRCTDLVSGGPQVLAVCDSDVLILPDGTPALDVPTGIVPTSVVPRRDGAWMSSTAGLLERVGRDVVLHWSPDHGQVLDLTRLDGGMLAAAGADGAWLVEESGVRALHPDDGLPRGAATAVGPHPHPQKAWLGTTRGVALVTSLGTGSPLPLAPLPANVPVHGLALGDGGVAVASDVGLAWLGKSPPTGWETLVAAAPQPLDFLFSGRDWWVATPTGAVRLDRRGRLEHFSVHATPIDLLALESYVGVRTERGLSWWTRDAEMLSPTDRLDAHHVDSAEGMLWIHDDHTVTASFAGEREQWTLEAEVRDLAAVRGAAWLATRQGLWSTKLDADPARAWPDEVPDDLVTVEVGGGRLWFASADGGLYVVDSGAPERVPWAEGAAVHELVADALGVWVLTDLGVYRVVLRGTSRRR
jgi:ligand-binding sensor domain-containing protein